MHGNTLLFVPFYFTVYFVEKVYAKTTRMRVQL